jgi:hypothetical protein
MIRGPRRLAEREDYLVTYKVQWVVSFFISTVLLTACQGTGQVHNFTPKAMPSPSLRSEAFHDDSLKILVQAFRDKRSQQRHIGTRTHFWGGATHFNVWNGQLGDGMADLAIEYLQQRKWQAARDQKVSEENGPAGDVILTGDILNFEATGKSGFGFTDIAVKIRVGFVAKNLADGSTVNMVLAANGNDSMMFFSPKAVEHLTNAVAKDLFRQLFQDLTVKEKTLQLKRDTVSLAP